MREVLPDLWSQLGADMTTHTCSRDGGWLTCIACRPEREAWAQLFGSVSDQLHVETPDPYATTRCDYGTATTDPLGRDDWPIDKRTRLPTPPKP